MQMKYFLTTILMYSAVLPSFVLRGILFTQNAHKINYSASNSLINETLTVYDKQWNSVTTTHKGELGGLFGKPQK